MSTLTRPRRKTHQRNRIAEYTGGLFDDVIAHDPSDPNQIPLFAPAIDDDRIIDLAKEQPYPLLFTAVCGDHQFGLGTKESAMRIRGIHVLPVREMLGLGDPPQSIEVTELVGKRKVEIATYDIKLLLTQLLSKNGTFLEYIFSHNVIHSTPELLELRSLAEWTVTKNHVYHYLGQARLQWRAFVDDRHHHAIGLLRSFRSLLTGIALMRTGSIETNIRSLNASIDEVEIDLLLGGYDRNAHMTIPKAAVCTHHKEFEGLCQTLEIAARRTSLPSEIPTNTLSELEEWLLRTRTHEFSHPC